MDKWIHTLGTTSSLPSSPRFDPIKSTRFDTHWLEHLDACEALKREVLSGSWEGQHLRNKIVLNRMVSHSQILLSNKLQKVSFSLSFSHLHFILLHQATTLSATSQAPSYARGRLKLEQTVRSPPF